MACFHEQLLHFHFFQIPNSVCMGNVFTFFYSYTKGSRTQRAESKLFSSLVGPTWLAFSGLGVLINVFNFWCAIFVRTTGTPSKYHQISFFGEAISINSFLSALGPSYAFSKFLLLPGVTQQMHLRWLFFWRFSLPAPLPDEHITTEFIHALFASIKGKGP